MLPNNLLSTPKAPGGADWQFKGGKGAMVAPKAGFGGGLGGGLGGGVGGLLGGLPGKGLGGLPGMPNPLSGGLGGGLPGKGAGLPGGKGAAPLGNPLMSGSAGPPKASLMGGFGGATMPGMGLPGMTMPGMNPLGQAAGGMVLPPGGMPMQGGNVDVMALLGGVIGQQNLQNLINSGQVPTQMNNQQGGGKKGGKGGNRGRTCHNCGGDHMARDCTEPKKCYTCQGEYGNCACTQGGGKSRSKGGDGRMPEGPTLRVENLDSRTRRDELHRLFSQAGQVMGVKVLKKGPGGQEKDPREPITALVVFDNEDGLRKAIADYNAYDYNGQKIYVREYTKDGPPKDGKGKGGGGRLPEGPTIRIEGLQDTATHESLTKLCEWIGAVEAAKVLRQNRDGWMDITGLVVFKDDETKEKAIYKLNNYEHEGKTLYVRDYKVGGRGKGDRDKDKGKGNRHEKQKPEKLPEGPSIRVEGITGDCTTDILKGFFAIVGKVIGAKIMEARRKGKGKGRRGEGKITGVVVFEQEESKTKAIDNMRYLELSDCTINVSEFKNEVVKLDFSALEGEGDKTMLEEDDVLVDVEELEEEAEDEDLEALEELARGLEGLENLADEDLEIDDSEDEEEEEAPNLFDTAYLGRTDGILAQEQQAAGEGEQAAAAWTDPNASAEAAPVAQPAAWMLDPSLVQAEPAPDAGQPQQAQQDGQQSYAAPPDAGAAAPAPMETSAPAEAAPDAAPPPRAPEETEEKKEKPKKRMALKAGDHVKITDPEGKELPARAAHTFTECPLGDDLQKAVVKAGFSTPTPIQGYSWPIAMQGFDVVGIASTGSGKTVAYLFPAFVHIIKNKVRPGDPVLIALAPTRELACQIEKMSNEFGKPCEIETVCVYGGAPRNEQLREVKRGCHVIVGTPGRLNDFLENRELDLGQIAKLVIDEADRMLDLGFEPQIRKIMRECPRKRQTLFWTATWPDTVRKLAMEFLYQPYLIQVGSTEKLRAADTITQVVKIVEHDKKVRELTKVFLKHDISERGSGDNRALIFCSTKKMCEQLEDGLNRAKVNCDSIHGDRTQSEREKALNDLRDGRTKILCCTDVAARGLDIQGVTVVVNYDPPNSNEDYVHRIGRTGRAGKKGTAVTFFTDRDQYKAKEVMEVMENSNVEIPKELRDLVNGKYRAPGGGSGGGGRDWDGGGGRGRDRSRSRGRRGRSRSRSRRGRDRSRSRDRKRSRSRDRKRSRSRSKDKRRKDSRSRSPKKARSSNFSNDDGPWRPPSDGP